MHRIYKWGSPAFQQKHVDPTEVRNKAARDWMLSNGRGFCKWRSWMLKTTFMRSVLILQIGWGSAELEVQAAELELSNPDLPDLFSGVSHTSTLFGYFQGQGGCCLPGHTAECGTELTSNKHFVLNSFVLPFLFMSSLTSFLPIINDCFLPNDINEDC